MMSDISQIKVSNIVYNIKDTTARQVATDESVGLVKPDGVSIFVDENGTLSYGGATGSNIYITTNENSLIGKTVTATDGVITKTAIIDSNKTATISNFMGTGWVTITASDGTNTAYAYANCSYYGTYRVTLKIWSATVNLSTEERSLYGGPVYVTSDVAPNETLTFDYSGQATYIARAPGKYIFFIV